MKTISKQKIDRGIDMVNNPCGCKTYTVYKYVEGSNPKQILEDSKKEFVRHCEEHDKDSVKFEDLLDDFDDRLDQWAEEWHLEPREHDHKVWVYKDILHCGYIWKKDSLLDVFSGEFMEFYKDTLSAAETRKYSEILTNEKDLIWCLRAVLLRRSDLIAERNFKKFNELMPKDKGELNDILFRAMEYLATNKKIPSPSESIRFIYELEEEPTFDENDEDGSTYKRNENDPYSKMSNEVRVLIEREKLKFKLALWRKILDHVDRNVLIKIISDIEKDVLFLRFYEYRVKE